MVSGHTAMGYISRVKRLHFVGRVSAVLLLLLGFSIVFPIKIELSSSYALDRASEPTTSGNTSTTTLTLNLSNNTLPLDLIPSSNGNFSTSSPASINVTTNHVTGYTLSVKAKVNNTNLVNTEDSTKTISSISSAISSTAFANVSNTQYNNKWGYSPSKLNSANNSQYLPSPGYNTATVLNATASANSTADSYTITLGARVDNTLPVGAYEQIFTIIALGNPVNYSITYNANDGANGANTTNMPSPNPQTGSTSSTTVTLSNNKPQRTGYDFKGWCNIQPTADSNYPNDQNCTGSGATLYQPGADLGINQTTINTVTLYATWWQPNLTKLNGKTMQEMSPMACYNSSINDTATLTDNRDGTTRSYTVAKLADGLCWMTTNLNLGKSNGDITLTPNNTDITTDFILPASSTDYSTTNNADNINAPYNLNNHTIMSHTVNGVTYTTSVASYYTYAAATADINTYDKGSSSYVTTSICPKNWDLPTDSQYVNLRTKGSITSANVAFASPYTFTYGGYRNGVSSFYSESSRGYYWTSRNYGRSSAYRTYVYSSGLYDSSISGSKWYSAMIRCVASQGTTTVSYNGNGTTEYPATGTTATQENVEINSTMARANGFTRTGWWFNGWNTAPDGSGIAIAANAPLSNLGLAPSSTITLYAQWLPQYTITYTNNCKSWASSDSNCTDNASNITSNQTINLDASGNGSGTLGAYNKFSLTGWKIKEWTTNADGTGTAYPVGDTYNVTSASAGDDITLYAHWAPVYTVQYDGNSADNPNGMGVADATTGIKPVRHYNVSEGDTFDLFASNFKRDGYGFVGWSTDASAWTHLTDNDNTNDPKIWGPNEVFTAPAYVGSPITTLYAVWAPAEKDGSNNPVYLQGWNGCSAMTATTYNSSTGTLTVAKNTVTALTDKRDGMVYAVAKLADNNCWMIENLRLDTAGTVGQNTIDSSVTNESLSQGYGGVFTGLPNTESINFGGTNANSLYTTDTTSTTLNILTGNYLAYRFPRYNNSNTTWYNNSSYAVTPTAPSQNVTSAYAHTDYDNGVYSYGNYYTWASAIADTGEYTSYGDHSKSDTSICPAGWYLPLGGTSNSVGGFSYLDRELGGTGQDESTIVASNRWRTFPNNFVYSGFISSSSAGGRGSIGIYWSSSASGNNAAYRLDLYNSVSLSSLNRSRGISVRCVADNFYSILYDGNGATAGSMYSFGREVKHVELNEGDTVKLVAPNYQKDGYGFAGWSPNPNATIGGTAPIYGPNETITVSSSILNQYANDRRQVVLYAVWVAKETNVTMQTFNATNYAAYNSAPVGTVIALEDTRDNNVYAVAKLADGKWWMIENLRLDNTATITTSNTHNPLHDANNNVILKIDYANNTTADHLASSSGGSWCNASSAACNDQTKLNTSNINRSLTASYSGNNYQWYGYGNYYNWYSATAGNGTYSFSNNNDSVAGDLCPVGWHLPKGGDKNNSANSEFWALAVASIGAEPANTSSETYPYYTGDTEGANASKVFRQFPNNIVYSGYYGIAAYDRGGGGSYWSSSARNSNTIYYLYLDNSVVRPATYVEKYFGLSVRCIAQ